MSTIIMGSAENPTLSLQVENEEGAKVQALHAGCYMRPGVGLSLNIDVQNPELVQANLADIQDRLSTFVGEAFQRAAELGIPVPKAE